MNPIHSYKTVAELLADEKRWTQLANARDSRRAPVAPESNSAVCFCVVGAARLIYGSGSSQLDEAIKKFKQVTGSWASTFNDTHTHAEVLEKVKEAGI